MRRRVPRERYRYRNTRALVRPPPTAYLVETVSLPVACLVSDTKVRPRAAARVVSPPLILSTSTAALHILAARNRQRRAREKTVREAPSREALHVVRAAAHLRGHARAGYEHRGLVLHLLALAGLRSG